MAEVKRNQMARVCLDRNVMRATVCCFSGHCHTPGFGQFFLGGMEVDKDIIVNVCGGHTHHKLKIKKILFFRL